VIVMDTSAMVEFLVGADPLADKVRAVTMGERMAAPHAIDLECASTLRGLVRGNKLPADEARRALDLLGARTTAASVSSTRTPAGSRG
jgi:predicted nucleic acid-binding protein